MVKKSLEKISIMFGASVLSIIIGFIISIFNSRILGPEQFGNFKFIETIARFIASIVSVGFFISLTRLLAINQDKSKEKKYIGLFSVIFGITSILGIIIYIAFSYLEPHIFNNNLQIPIHDYFFIVSSIIGYAAILEILKGLHKINTLAIVNVTPLIGYLIIAYVVNLYIPLNISSVLLLTYGIILSIIIFILIKLKPDFNFNKKLVNDLLLENKFNGKPIYFGSLAGVATTHIAGLSISFFMDNTQVGFFMLASTICSPLLVIPSVLGTIFFKQFVNMNSIPKKVYFFSIISTFLALILFYSIIEIIIVSFYTEAYLPVSNISKYLIVGFIFHGFGDLINRFLGAKGKGKWLRNVAFMVGAVNILGYTLLIKFYNINGAILTKIIASGLYLILMIIYYVNFIKKTNV